MLTCISNHLLTFLVVFLTVEECLEVFSGTWQIYILLSNLQYLLITQIANLCYLVCTLGVLTFFFFYLFAVPYLRTL